MNFVGEMYESEDELADFFDDNSGILEDHFEIESDTESEEEEEGDVLENEFYISKSKEKWYKKPQIIVGRRNRSNILDKSFSLTEISQRIANIEDSFDIFINQEMLMKVCDYTNKFAQTKNTNWNQLDIKELKKTIGILILLGVYQSKNESVNNLWDITHGRKVIRNAMKLNRFQNILRNLRFDDKAERGYGTLAPFEEMFELFRRNMSKGIIPSENLTIDEQLVTFFGRCSFKTFMPNKPGKYGIKIWTLCDVKTSYCLNQIIYLGKKTENSTPEKNLSMNVVLDLITSYNSDLKGRNITTDSYFTSLELSKELLKKDITIVGTIDKKRVEVPPQFKSYKNKEIGEKNW